jgi:hypothetical protein
MIVKNIYNGLLVEYAKPIIEFFIYSLSNRDKLTQKMKLRFLIQNGLENAIWIETGTYRGTTTSHLSSSFPDAYIYSIEASKKLFKQAEFRFRKRRNIKLYYGNSPENLKKILSGISSSVNFWLDAHFSGGSTHKEGTLDSPLRDELKVISEFINKGFKIRIFIDDYDLIQDTSSLSYPSKVEIIEFAHACRLKIKTHKNTVMLY